MATDDQDASGGSLFALISLTAVAVTATVGFGRVFQGTETTFKLCLVGAASVALAWALGGRHVLVSVLATLAGLVLCIGLAVFPGTTRFGIPTGSTFHAALTALPLVGNTANVQVAPAIPLPPLLIAAVIAVWSAGFALHALAVRARSPFLAILPPASLLAFSNVVIDDGVRPAYVLFFLAAALALLFGDAVRRVRHWGPVSIWRSGFEPARDDLWARVASSLHAGTSASGRPARRLAIAAVVVAAVGAWALPGFRSPGILSLSSDSSPLHVSIDPIVDIKPALLNNKPVPLFTVRSLRPSYWRFLALDRFDGQRWTSSNLQAAGGQVLGSGTLVSPGQLHLELTGPNSSFLEQQVTLQKLNQPWLPAAYDPVSVSVTGSQVRYDPVGQVLFSPGGTYPGFSYEVTSIVEVPTIGDLEASSLPPAAVRRPYTALPADTPREIFRIAHRIADSKPTVYEKVRAIQDYLRENFRYDLHVPAGHDTNHILTFLTKTKAGYCEQFAGSMAVLLRALGIPARVAVGFTPGHFEHGHWQVTLQNAHAWVEVLFPTYGWLAFEPTPTRFNPTTEPYTDAAITNIGGITACNNPNPALCTSPSGTTSNDKPQPSASKRPRVGSGIAEGLPPENIPPGSPTAAPPPGPGRWRGRAVLAVLGILILLGMAIPWVKFARRRLILAGAKDPRERVLAVFDVMTQSAADVGLGRLPHETVREYRGRLRDRVASLNGDLDRLTALTSAAAYSTNPVTGADAGAAMASARRVTGELRRAAGPGRRIVGWFRLPGRVAQG